MNEQQQQIKNNLISLVKKGVRVYFKSTLEQSGCHDDRSLKSDINVRDGGYISKTTLLLVKEDTLEEWEQAIQKAEHAEAQRVLEREYDYNSPNFYKAITSFISDLEQDL